MPSGTSRFRGGRRSIAALIFAAGLVSGPAPASAFEGRSSPEDRQRFVSITRSLQEAPLKESLKADRAWALEWLTKASDISVTVCPKPLGGVVGGKYRYGGEILAQDIFSMAALAIEHPDAANDPAARQLAGVEGALSAYRAILRDKPDARSPALETLVQVQARGELPAFVRKAWISCSKK